MSVAFDELASALIFDDMLLLLLLLMLKFDDVLAWALEFEDVALIELIFELLELIFELLELIFELLPLLALEEMLLLALTLRFCSASISI
jgi:hypothetical protein